MSNLAPTISRFALAVLALAFSACVTSRPPLGPNQARVTGNQQLLVARADAPSPRPYAMDLIVPAGKTRLAFKPGYSQGAGLLVILAEDAITKNKVKEVDLNAKAGHEYDAQLNPKPFIKPYWNRGILIIDRATKTTVAEVPPQ